MTYHFNQNITPVHGVDAIFQWKQFMVGAPGWTITASSDGTTTANSDIITSAGTGAGGLLNTRAWFVIQQPASTRQFCFQTIGVHTPPLSPNGANWRVKYSPSGFVNGGAPTITPTANNSIYTGAEDAGVVIGSALGTDATPDGAVLFGTDGTYKMQMMADDTAPNAFYWFCTTTPTTNISSGFSFDPMTTGTFPGADPDPYAIYHATSSFSKIISITGQTTAPFSYLKRGMTGETFDHISAGTFCADSGTTPLIGGLPSNPTNGTDDLLPVIYARPPAWNAVGQPAGYKGVSSLMKWCTTARTTTDMLSVVTPGDRIVVGNTTFPWNNTNPSL
jgi:hypothetical protein